MKRKNAFQKVREVGYTDMHPCASYERILNLIIHYWNRSPNPNLGERSMHAYILSQGYRASRARRCTSIQYLDPGGSSVRIRRRLKRREFVVSLGVDGCTRTIIHLRIAENNEELTTLDAFMTGVEN